MSATTRIRRAALALAALGGAAALAAPAMALSPAPPEAGFVEGPAVVLVTVPADYGALTAGRGDIEATDADPSDGRVTIRASDTGVQVWAREDSRLGVGLRTESVPGGDEIQITTQPGRFAFASYSIAPGGGALQIRLWKSDPRFPGATRRDDGCLRITSHAGTTGQVSVRGLERRPLFEHNVVLQLRDSDGRSVGLRPVTARNGQWSGTVRHSVARRQRGTLQAWVTSARDGALECLVQVPVTLAPRAR